MDPSQRELLLRAIAEATGGEDAVDVTPDLPEKRYRVERVTQAAVRPLSPAGAVAGSRIAYVDGGNAELIRAPHLSLSLVRTCALSYRCAGKGLAREKSVRDEFFVLVRAVRSPELRFEASLFRPGKTETLAFDPADQALLVGRNRAEPSSIAGVVRRFSELRLAAETAEALSAGDAVVLDGTLEAVYPGESALAEAAAAATSSRGVAFAALAKRCTLLSTAGKPLLNEIGRVAGEAQAPWSCGFASGTGQEHSATVLAAKFHKRARHVFRIDIHAGASPEQAGRLLSLLALHSRDATFPGYPYGLVEADRLARVSNATQQYHRMLLEGRLGKRWRPLFEAMASMDAHDILDSM